MSRSEVKADAAFHTFDPEIAIQVGVNAAVVYRNLVFWVRHNEANRRNFHEGRYWTYNSLAAFDQQFPYLTAKQIRTALDKLVEAALILKGNFAEDRFKRATWYALGEPICPQGQMEQPVTADDTFAPEGGTSAPEGKCIMNRYKPDSKPYPPNAEAAVTEADLEKIWAAYPEDRRRAKPACHRHIRDALTEMTADELIAAVQAYAAESSGFTRTKVCFADNWFRNRKWQRHLDEVRAQGKAKRVTEATLLAQAVSWIRSASPMCRHVSKAQVVAAINAGLIDHEEAIAVGAY